MKATSKTAPAADNSAVSKAHSSNIVAAQKRQLDHQGEIPESKQVDEHITIIEPPGGLRLFNLKELWLYRELLYFLVWRDVKVRYKQTVLGAAWAIIQPFTTMVVFSLFFGRLAQMPSAGTPYPLFVFCGLLPWTFFSSGITAAGQSMVGNQNLITKVYFPRLIIPISSVGAGLVDFIIAFGMLLLIMAYYAVLPHWTILFVPLIMAGLVVTAIGVGMLLSALTVAYRDFRHAVPFLIQLWMFATPSIYMHTDTVVNPRWRSVLPLNPVYGLIASLRAAVLGTQFDSFALILSLVSAVLIFIIACLYFRRVESSFADVI